MTVPASCRLSAGTDSNAEHKHTGIGRPHAGHSCRFPMRVY